MALSAALLVVGCASKQTPAERPATARERALPFTGRWRIPGEPSPLRLYQTDAKTVVGSIASAGASGMIEPDGTLYLAVGKATSVTIYSLSKSGSTLVVRRRVSSMLGDAWVDSMTWKRE